MIDQEKESTLIAFVGREHLVSISKHLVNFLNEGESFMRYERPSQVIEDKTLRTDDAKRKEYLKRIALHNMIMESGNMEYQTPPFIHTEKDLMYQRA